MTKEIRLNAFDMNCVGHIQHGMWTHPRDRSTEYKTIRYWQDLARRCQINLRRAARTRNRMRIHTAATAFRHSLAASARKIRSVDRETRWR